MGKEEEEQAASSPHAQEIPAPKAPTSCVLTQALATRSLGLCSQASPKFLQGCMEVTVEAMGVLSSPVERGVGREKASSRYSGRTGWFDWLCSKPPERAHLGAGQRGRGAMRTREARLQRQKVDQESAEPRGGVQEGSSAQQRGCKTEQENEP